MAWTQMTGIFRPLDNAVRVQKLKHNSNVCNHHHHHHVQEGLGLIPVSFTLKMKLVPPSLPRSSYVSSYFWFIL